jgi:phospholipase/carboxylesterase
MERLDPPLEIEIGPRPTASVIWLHGLGADGHDFEPIVPELLLPPNLSVRFVFPHAPHRPITINGGYVMRAWYDIAEIAIDADQDAAGIRDSEARVRALIAREQDRGIPVGRVVLAGFSQGGAMALHTGLRYPEPLAGILSLSTYLPLHDLIDSELNHGNLSVPIFMAHGSADDVVPFALGEASYHLLQALGARIEWHSYPMRHALMPQEIADIGRWLQTVLT